MSPLPFLLLGAVVFLSRWRDDTARPLALAARLVPVVDQGAGAALAQAGGHLAVLALIALAGAGCVAAGRRVRRMAAVSGGGLEAAVLDGAGGLAAASALWLGLGLAGLAFRPVAGAFVLAAALAGARGALRFARAGRAHPGLGFAALVAVVPALVPETEVDALVYHLALP